MRKPFGGGSLGGESSATAHSKEIWMSWFEPGSETDAENQSKPSGQTELAAKGAAPVVPGRSALDALSKESKRTVAGGTAFNEVSELAERKLAIQSKVFRGPVAETPPPLPAMAILSPSAAQAVERQPTLASGDKTTSAFRLPQIDKVTSDIAPLPAAIPRVPALERGAVADCTTVIERLPIKERPTVSERLPIAQRVELNQATQRALPSENRVRANTSEIHIASLKAADSATQMEKQALGSPEPVSPFSLAESLRSPESESSKTLAARGLYNKFTGTNCHEHISWGPDGSVSVALKSACGYRRTIVCRTNNTSAERITDPTGKEMLRFSNNSLVVDNLV